jgi:hypothetical protein
VYQDKDDPMRRLHSAAHAHALDLKYNGVLRFGLTLEGMIDKMGREITGTAAWKNHMEGKIQGVPNASQLGSIIPCPNDLKGTYRGTIPSAGRLTASGSSTSNQDNDTATWQAGFGHPPTIPTDIHVQGKWTIQQKNARGVTFTGILILTQNGSAITGTAAWGGHMDGKIQGSLNGSQLELTILYPNDLKGTYRGTISSAGRLTASGSSTSNQDNDTATWQAQLE